MGSSSGSGSIKVGGSVSSSSSTLSASAPPFKIDKSISKPNSKSSLFERPAYGTVFDPVGPLWNASSSSSVTGPKFVATEVTGGNTTCMPSPEIYGCPFSQSNNSHTGVCYDHGTAYDHFPYDQFPKRMSTGADEVATPYFLPYVSPPAKKDGSSKTGVVTRPRYDLLSNSSSVNLSGCGSSHIGHTLGVSGHGDSDSRWSDFVTRMDDGAHGEWKGYAQGFGSKDINPSSLSSTMSGFSVDGTNESLPFVDVSNKIHPFVVRSDDVLLEKGTCPTQGLACSGNVSTFSGNCFDIVSGAYRVGNLGLDQQKYKPSFDLDLGGTSADCSNMPTFVSLSYSTEISHRQEPVLEPVTSFCGAQKGNCSTSEEHISQTGSFVFNCTSTTSSFPITMSNLPYSGGNFSGESVFSATKMNSAGSDALKKGFTSSGCDSSYQKTPQIPPGLKCQSSIVVKKPLSSVAAASVSQTGETVTRRDDKDTSDKPQYMPEVSSESSSNGFGLETNVTEIVFPVEKHFGGYDVHNPAEDSPCWKGASYSHVSPFGVSEDLVPNVLVENLEGLNVQCSQEAQNKTFLVDTSLPVKVPSESSSLKRPSDSSCTSKDQEVLGLMSQKPNCFDLNNAGVELHCVDECQVSSKNLNVLNKTKTDSNSSTLCIIKDGASSFARNLSESAAAADMNDNCDPLSTNSCFGVPSNICKGICSLPFGDKSSLKFCQLPMKEVSDAEIDIKVLLNSMINLSEVLRCYCLSNPAAVMQQHSETVEHIIGNLNASLMASGPTTPSMMVSSRGSSFQKELFAAEMVSSAEAVAAAVKLGRRSQVFLGSPFRDDSNTSDNDTMIEAIKKVLLENIGEEEMDQHNFLYKSLWLEAEAALCAMTAKARLQRVKTEMEKPSANTEDTKKLPCSYITSNMHSIVELVGKDKASPTSVVCDSVSPRTGAASQRKVPIMNEFHIANPKGGLHSMNFEGLQFTEKEVCFPTLHTTSPCTSSNHFDDSGTASLSNDAETSFTARYHILNNRIDLSNSFSFDGKQSSGEYTCLLDKDYSGLETLGNDPHGPGPNSHVARCEILRSQVEHHDSLKCVGKQSSGKEEYIPDNVISKPDKSFLNFKSSNSIGATDDDESSVMARFRILQNQVKCPNTVGNDIPKPVQWSASRANEVQGSGWSKRVTQSNFGPYPDFRAEDVKEFGFCVDGQASRKPWKPVKPNSEILERWYGSENDWEHVSKEDARRQN